MTKIITAYDIIVLKTKCQNNKGTIFQVLNPYRRKAEITVEV